MNTTVFKTIGIGVTFSPNLEANINEAARLALFFGSKLILIHVGKSSEDKLTAFSSLLSSFKDQGLVFEVTFNSGDPVEVITKGRHDPCVGIRATPIAEAMLALVVIDHVMQHRAQCGDVVQPAKT